MVRPSSHGCDVVRLRVRAVRLRRVRAPRAVDAWGMGCLMQEIFSGRRLARTEDLRELSRVPPALHKQYQRLLGSVPTRRMNPAALLESEFFQNKLVRRPRGVARV